MTEDEFDREVESFYGGFGSLKAFAEEHDLLDVSEEIVPADAVSTITAGRCIEDLLQMVGCLVQGYAGGPFVVFHEGRFYPPSAELFNECVDRMRKALVRYD